MPARPAAPSRTDRRTAIVEVAFRLIAQRGLEGLRFADVAQAAGINNGTLLYYFASKDALIQAVGAYLVDRFVAGAQPPQGDAPHDAIAQLEWEFADARAHLGDDLGVVWVELLARAHRDPEVAALLRRIDDSWRTWLVSVIERGRADGSIRSDVDADLVASAIMATIRGVGTQALIQGNPLAAEPLMDALGDRMIALIRA